MPAIMTRLELTTDFSTRRLLESRAERLVAEYLRTWGLRDPQTIATLSKRWVRQASDSLFADGKTCTSRDFLRAVLRHAGKSMAARLDQLAQRVSTTANDAQSRRGLMAIQMRGLLDAFPHEAVTGTVPTKTVDRLSATSRRVVPPTKLTQMPEQSLEPAIKKQLARWRSAPAAAWQRMRGTLLDPVGG